MLRVTWHMMLTQNNTRDCTIKNLALTFWLCSWYCVCDFCKWLLQITDTKYGAICCPSNNITFVSSEVRFPSLSTTHASPPVTCFGVWNVAFINNNYAFPRGGGMLQVFERRRSSSQFSACLLPQWDDLSVFDFDFIALKAVKDSIGLF